MKLKFTAFGSTDVGKYRTNNEDNLLLGTNLSKRNWNENSVDSIPIDGEGALLVVADGMGGAVAGEIASTIAVDTVRNIFEKEKKIPSSDKDIEDLLKYIIYESHHRIVKEATSNNSLMGMGTTLTIALIKEYKVYIAWCGDSRVYRFSTNGVPASKHYDSQCLEILTSDHSLVWKMVEKNKISAEEARVHPQSNIITQSLGDPGNPPKPDTKIVSLRKGDRILVCSDGLNSMLPDFEIESILSMPTSSKETCEKLIQIANQAGGEDNITVIVSDIVEGPIAPMAKSSDKGRIRAVTTKQQSLDGSKKRRNVTQVIKAPSSKKPLRILAGISGLLLLFSFLWFSKGKSDTPKIVKDTTNSIEQKEREETQLSTSTSEKEFSIPRFFFEQIDTLKQDKDDFAARHLESIESFEKAKIASNDFDKYFLNLKDSLSKNNAEGTDTIGWSTNIQELNILYLRFKKIVRDLEKKAVPDDLEKDTLGNAKTVQINYKKGFEKLKTSIVDFEKLAIDFEKNKSTQENGINIKQTCKALLLRIDKALDSDEGNFKLANISEVKTEYENIQRNVDFLEKRVELAKKQLELTKGIEGKDTLQNKH